VGEDHFAASQIQKGGAVFSWVWQKVGALSKGSSCKTRFSCTLGNRTTFRPVLLVVALCVRNADPSPPLSTSINLRRVEKGPRMTNNPQALTPAENHLFPSNVDNFEPPPKCISCFLVPLMTSPSCTPSLPWFTLMGHQLAQLFCFFPS
jgi:hypothetical protein